MILKENNSSAPPENFTSIDRLEVNYKNYSEKFKCSSKDFTKQFAHIYAGRLTHSRERLLSKVKRKWGKNAQIKILSELADGEIKQCVVIGTLYKHQELKPSLLKEISEEHQLVPQPVTTHYTSPEDLLVLEDETQRIRLVGELDIKSLATGIVIAVLGHENEDGRFQVEDYCFPGVDEVPKNLSPLVKEDCYVLLASGLELSSTADLLSVELFTDWVTGVSGGAVDQAMASKVTRVVLAGNCIGAPPPCETTEVGTIAESSVIEAVKLLDNVLGELASSIAVDIMPGEYDPSNHTLPQQPLHTCMFPTAARLESLRVVSNPYQLSVGGRLVLGTAGQPISNLMRVTDGCDSLDLLSKTLEWGHLAPTAPDTLACYPYYQTDPFIIEELPHVYFAGNQPAFQTSLITRDSGEQVRLICVPQFCQTKQCVLVNLRNLDCQTITFTTHN